MDETQLHDLVQRIDAFLAPSLAARAFVDDRRPTNGQDRPMTFRETPPGAPLLIFAENVTALDPATGRKLWEYDPGSDAVRRFAMSSERVFLLDGGSVIHCLLTATGQLLGKVETGILNAESMMIDGERLYVVGTMEVFALDLDGRTLWQVRVAHNQRHTLSGMGIPGGASIQPDFSKG